MLRPVPDPVPEKKVCQTDGDCPSKQACFGEYIGCKNPCIHLTPCDVNADCSVKDELPWRVMVCTCRPGYKQTHDKRCELIRE